MRRRRPRRRARTPPISTEIYAEGLRIAPMKLYEAGKLNKTIMTFIEKNVRLPVQLFGDLRAQLAACHIAETQFAELVARYGPEQTKALPATRSIDYAERLTRAALEQAARRRMELRGLDRRRRRRLRQADPPVRHHHARRAATWWSTGPAPTPQVKGAINNTLSFTKAALLHRRALGAAARHPQQRGRVPRHRGDLPARHGRQRRAAGGLRRRAA